MSLVPPRISCRKSHINPYNSMPYCVACVVHRDSLGCLWYNFHYTAKPAKSATPGSVCGSQHRCLIFSCWFSLGQENPRGRQKAWNDADIFLSLQVKNICGQFQWRVKRTFVTGQVFYGFDIFLTALRQLSVGFLAWIIIVDIHLKTKMRKWVVFFDELWVSSSTRRNKWQDFIVESFL